MFESIKIVPTIEGVRSFVPKGWTNITQSKLTVIKFSKLTQTFDIFDSRHF